MCDYSLENYQSRPVDANENLTLHRFPSGTMGFVGKSKTPTPATGGTTKAVIDDNCAVCIKEGTRLELSGIDGATQRANGIGPSEQVVMTRIEGGPHVHHDAVRFANGKEVLLQSLNAGLTATPIAADYTEQVSRIADAIENDGHVDGKAPSDRELAMT